MATVRQRFERVEIAGTDEATLSATELNASAKGEPYGYVSSPDASTQGSVGSTIPRGISVSCDERRREAATEPERKRRRGRRAVL